MINHRVKLTIVLSLSFVLLVVDTLRWNVRWNMLNHSILVALTEPDRMLQSLQSATACIENLNVDITPHSANVNYTQDWLMANVERAKLVAYNRGVYEATEKSKRLLERSRGKDNVCSQLQSLDAKYDDTEVTLLYIICLMRNGRAQRAAVLLDALGAKTPSRLLANQPQVGSVTLIGYDLLRLDLYPVSTTYRVILYSRIPRREEPRFAPSTGEYEWDTHRIQVIVAKNKLPNGDAEQLILREPHAASYPWRVAFHDDPIDPNIIRIRVDRCANNRYFRLDNVLGSTIVYVYLHYSHLSAESTYLLLGDIRSNGSGVYQIMEYADDKNQYPVQMYYQPSSDWTSYGDLFRPIEGRRLGVYVSIKGAVSNFVEFDNLVVIEANMHE